MYCQQRVLSAVRWQRGQACGSGTEGSGTVPSMKLALQAALLSPSPRLCVSSSLSDFFSSNSRARVSQERPTLSMLCAQLVCGGQDGR